MPVRMNRNREVVTIEVGEEVFRCRWLTPKEFWTTFHKYGHYEPLPPDERTEDQEAVFVIENRFGFAYEMGGKAIIGWSGVKDEDGEEVKFSKEMIDHLDVDVAAKVASEYTRIWTAKEEKRGEEEKNSPPTSPA
jgi:hypothetical protein